MSGWVQVYGQIVKESASGKAILFQFNPPIRRGYGNKIEERIWIPKKCFKTNDLGSQFISSWFWKKIMDGTNGLRNPPTKKELVAKYTRRIEANESFVKIEKPADEPEFFGNVDKVLEKILN